MPGGMTAAATRHSLQRQGIAKTELERQALTLDMGAPVTAALSIGGCVAAGFGDGVVRFFSPDAAPIAVAAHRGAVLCLAADGTSGAVLTGATMAGFCAYPPMGL